MDRAAALAHLGLPLDASPDAVDESVRARAAELDQRASRAPTPALKAKFMAAKDELAHVRSAAHAAGPAQPQVPTGTPFPHAQPAAASPLAGLSATQMRDLPGAVSGLTSAPFATPQPGAAPALGAHGAQGATGTQGGGPPVDPSLGVRTGDVLAGRYEVRRALGQGGMGAVFAAFDRVRAEEVAIKILIPSLMAHEGARERFLAEAKLSSSLSHPNIVRVFDVQTGSGLDFLTMELLQGKTLRADIEERRAWKRTFDVAAARKVCRSVGEALHYAHGFTVHRDIKPENIWIGQDGTIKIMDFGIARILRSSRRTTAGLALGTAYYMAPEQLKGAKEQDGRADQYALAIVLYELLSGELPTGRIEPLRRTRRDVPAPLAAAIERGLSSAPTDRFATMKAFVDAACRAGPVVPVAWLAGAAGAAIAVGLAVALQHWGPFSEPEGAHDEGAKRPPVATAASTSAAKPAAEDPRRAGVVEALSIARATRDKLGEARARLSTAAREASQRADRLEEELRLAKDGAARKSLQEKLSQERRERELASRLRAVAEERVFAPAELAKIEGSLGAGEALLDGRRWDDALRAIGEAKARSHERQKALGELERRTGEVRAAGIEGRPALRAAVEAGLVEEARLLIALGASPDDRDAQDGLTPLGKALALGKADVASLLIEKRADLRTLDPEGRTVLHLAVIGGVEPLVQRLVSKGVDATTADRGGRTPLHEAARLGRDQAVRVLLAAGADPAARDAQGKAPADLANEAGRAATAALLGSLQPGGAEGVSSSAAGSLQPGGAEGVSSSAAGSLQPGGAEGVSSSAAGSLQPGGAEGVSSSAAEAGGRKE